jgi:hypothetical protein
MCPTCGDVDSVRVIYFGFPMWLCMDEECSTVWGFWSFMIDSFPMIGEDEDGDPCWAFFVYEGNYLKGLWQWMMAGAP